MADKNIPLQQIMQRQQQRSRVIAVTSGKGGVGKTNISVNIALCLAASDKKVLLMDADLSLGNIDVLLNINSKYNISHLLNGRKSVEEIIHTGAEGLEMIFGASGLEDLADLSSFQRQRLLGELENLHDNNELIIVDTAAGITKSVIGFCLASDQVLVVTTPQATSMTDAYAVIKILAKHNFKGRISLVVNMAETINEGRNTYQQISKVASQFLDIEVYNAAILLRDERLNRAVNLRKPVVHAFPHSRISRSLMGLSKKISSSNMVVTANSGFFKQVVNWFF